MRKSLALALMCVVSLSACKKESQQMGLTNWKNAPPLLAGVDTGTSPDAPALPPPAAPKLEGTPVAADQVPVRKAGLWQITTTNTTTGGNRGGGPNGGGGPNAGGAPTGGGAPNAGGGNPGGFQRPNGGGAPGADTGGGQRGPNGGGGPGGGNFAGGGRGGPQGPTKLCVTAETERQRGVFASTGRAAAPGCEPKIAKTANGYNAVSACTTNNSQQTSRMTLAGDLNSRYTITGTRTQNNPNFGAVTTQVRTTASYVGACPAGQKGGDQTSADGTVRNIFDAPQGGGGGGRRGGGGN